MDCEETNTCYGVKNHTVLAIIHEALQPGTPFSSFLLAVEIFICIVFFISIPYTRKDSIFCFLAIVFAPYLVKTCVEAAFFVSIYFYTASYTFWSWVHDSVVSFCYSSFLFNYQYGLVLYSWQTVYTAIKKKPVSKSSTRWPYIVIFFITLVQSAIFWQILTIGLTSALLILFLAPFTILLTFYCLLFRKTDKLSEYQVVRDVKSRLIWNLPCLLISMADIAAELYLNFRPNAYKTTAVQNKGYIFPIVFPDLVLITMFITLPGLRRAIFPCCFTNSTDNNSDRMFLITRSDSSNGSSAASERSSISTVTNQPIVTYPNNSVVPYNYGNPQYPYYPMPNMYPQGYGPGCTSEYPPGYSQSQPIFFPIPITFYNPSHVPTRSNDLPAVQ